MLDKKFGVFYNTPTLKQKGAYMKTEYRFRPANHWNVIPSEVYNALLPFYINDHPPRLMVTMVWNND